jgi:hypothetical protein
MKLFVLLTALLSTSVFAQDQLLKTIDGSVATCESKADVFNMTLKSVYRAKMVKVTEGTAELNIEFLKCVEKDGNFLFVTDKSLTSRTAYYNGRNLELTRSAPSLVVLDDELSKITVLKNSIKKNKDGTYQAKIQTAIQGGPSTSRTSSNVIEFAVRMEYKITDLDTLEILDHGVHFMGSYRLIIK